MSTLVAGGQKRTAILYQSVIGKKIIMAVTGFVLCGFVAGHMVGNLQLFAGPEKLNHYAELLQSLGGALWAIRGALLLAVGLHIAMALQLTKLKWEARPTAYVKKASIASSYASRTMIWSGPIIGAFLIYHLLHFTTGQAHPEFVRGDVYRNVVTGFQNPAVALFYMVANILLAIHLYHGVWSMFQSLGVAHPRYTPMLKTVAKGYGYVIGIGNVSMPLAVLAGLVK
ncbi:MAG: succinate dehydrogenase cytochrome b subunit [Bryobacteraceae bacterium]|nr:succinate dehydrogenase cytochrome b subunit [Bryobacteraceae bacterium]